MIGTLYTIFIGFGANYFNNNILTVSNSLYLLNYTVEAELISSEIKILPLVLMFLAFEGQSRMFECK
jgi:hypothetical protein